MQRILSLTEHAYRL